MPYEIGEHESCPADKPYAVLNSETGDLKGCHATQDSAKAQLAALYANVPDASKGIVLDEETALNLDPYSVRCFKGVGDGVVRKAGLIEPASKGRMYKMIASDEVPDRYGDIIRAEKWDLANFKRNPVLLWAHSQDKAPIGAVPEISTAGKRLVAEFEFIPEGINPEADMYRKLVDLGYVRASSVGFVPTVKPNVRMDQQQNVIGFDYVGQELIELSLVPVGANPNALAVAKSFGASDKTIERIFGMAGATAYLAAKKREIDLRRIRPSFRATAGSK